MSESHSKKRKIGDERAQRIRHQSSEEISDQPGDVAAASSEDSISMPAMILSPVSSVEAPSLADSLSKEDMEKSYTDCEEIVRKSQSITKNEHLVKNLSETNIGDIYENICLLWESLASEHQEIEHEIQSTSTQTTSSISNVTSKILNMIRNEIQVLRALEQSSEDPCKDSPSEPIPMEETSQQSIALPCEKESVQSTSSVFKVQSIVNSTYSLELMLKLIRYNQEQRVKNTSSMSSGETSGKSAKDSKEALHAEILKEIQICMTEEVKTLNTCIDNFQKPDCTSGKMDTPSDSEAASMESEDISVATEIQVISFSASAELKDDNSLQTKIKNVFGTSSTSQKEHETTDITTKETPAQSDIEMKEIAPLPVQEMLHSPPADDKSQIAQVSLIGDEGENASLQINYSQLELCVKSSRTDGGDGERSTGPCVTEDTLLSTPDEDTGRSISSIPWDSVSFNSSIPDEPLDSETEETQL